MMEVRELATKWGQRPAGNTWRGSCVVCGYKNSLSVTTRDDRVLWHCASCGDQRALAVAVRAVGGGLSHAAAPSHQPTRTATAAEKSAWARRLWERGMPATGGLADWYLRQRALPGLSASAALRFLPSARYRDAECWPALLAAITNPGGELIATHRTFLARDGSGKAPLDEPRMSVGPIWGGAVYLDPIAPEMLVAEGIETAASAGRLFKLPAIAAVSCGNLERHLSLPPEIRSILIAADNDPPDQRGKRPGQDPARAAARRWTAEGRRVRIKVPKVEGTDYNDVLMGRPDA